MSITGFYDTLSVKTWTENRLDAFQAYCAVQFAHNQETFMISVPTCMHVRYIREPCCYTFLTVFGMPRQKMPNKMFRC
jgi:hypothetical protein